MSSISAIGQTVEDVESSLNTTHGLEKLKALNMLTVYYRNTNPRKAMRYAKDAVNLGENMFVTGTMERDSSEWVHMIQAYFQLGVTYYDDEDYLDAREEFRIARAISLELEIDNYLPYIDEYMEDIQGRIDRGEVKENFWSRNFSRIDLDLGNKIKEGRTNLAIQTEIRLGRSDENSGAYEKAIDHYKKAIELSRDQGDAERIADLQLKVAILLDSLQQHNEAQQFLDDALVSAESFKPDSARVVNPADQDLRLSLNTEKMNLKKLADRYAEENDYEKSLEYYKLYEQLSEKMEQDSLQALALNERQEAELLLLRQQKQIADLNVEAAEQEKEKESRLRIAYTIVAGIVLIGILIVLYFYFNKRKQHLKLSVAYDDLDQAKNQLEDAEQRIKKLLEQQVSGDIAQELLVNGADKPVERRFVCVMFLDIRDFTPLAEKLNPEELIAFQNKVFGFMIDIIEKYNGNINQLLGDGFMATFGAPISRGNDCQNAFDASLEILEELKRRNAEGSTPGIRVGIGLHAGYVVTGNVGTELRKQYSVTGNPVIMASRVEQLNKTYHSQLMITEEVFEQLDQKPELNQGFSSVKVKGRSEPVNVVAVK